ncbi:MAG: 4Fe-4S dicluster domain-containing protein [Candidatus Bathyarchaeia archaeon]
MAKFKDRKFIAVEPGKCTGCSLCEYVCALEKKEAVWNPLRSRIRVIRVTPAFNLAMACRFCEDAPCIKACPRDALTQSEENGVIKVNEVKCDGCGWCVQACPYGGIAVHPDKRSVLVCDLCDGKPQCIEFCPEEALGLVTSDEEANRKLAMALGKLPAEIERLSNLAKGKAWDTLLVEAEGKAKRLSAKLEALNKKWIAK